ncbi:MAG: TIGR00153 family protein [Gammaproteobacteria bacterium]|nr:TIGR00153 family protein [Gammaproteobacteria bacterium]
MTVKNYLSGIFGQSPVKPLQQHMEKVVECTTKLIPFFEAVIAKDWDGALEARKAVSHLEGEADTIKTELRLHLPNSLFMPVARADLLDLLTVQDKIANKTKDITGLMMGRNMELPDSMGTVFLNYVKRSIDAAVQAKKTVNELDELFETGFRGTEVEIVQSMIKVLDKIEKDTDRMQIEIRAQIFSFENELPPIHAMFLYRIVDWIGDLGDLAQRVGSRLQLLLAR